MSATNVNIDYATRPESLAESLRPRFLNPNLQLARSDSESRLWVNLFFAYVAALTLGYGLVVTRISRSWIISDWLINYQGGPVRRGLPGQVAYVLAHLLHISPVAFAVFFYLSLYAVLFYAARRLALRSSRSLWLLALLVSPATFSFQLLHAQAGFRKELMYLAALSLFAVILGEKKQTSTTVSISLTIVAVVCVLSHESLLFYLPYFVAVLLIAGRPWRVVARECAVPAVAAMAAAFWCSRHLGNAQVATGICSSLGYKLLNPQGLDICGSGAIPYLATTSAMAHAEALRDFAQYHYLRVFPIFALVCFLPAVIESLALARSGASRMVGILWMFAALSFGGSIVLFTYGEDWGRWIYIHLMSITILLFFMDGQISRGAWLERIRFQRTPIANRVPVAGLLFLYAIAWALPNNLVESPRMGYLGSLSKVGHAVTHKVLGASGQK